MIATGSSLLVKLFPEGRGLERGKGNRARGCELGFGCKAEEVSSGSFPNSGGERITVYDALFVSLAKLENLELLRATETGFFG